MKIILFDGSFSTTSFINRLAKGLAERHQVFIVGFTKESSKRVPNVEYRSLGSNKSKIDLLLTSLKLAVGSKSLSTLYKTFSLFLGKRRPELQKHNLQLFLKKTQPDIIHLQWPATLEFFEEVIKMDQIPVILSQRGYQHNVRAVVDQKNKNYLKNWYPKLAGFHSVSQAMKRQGDGLYRSVDKIDHVVYTGVDSQEFTFEYRPKNSNELQIISVGRPHWVKGYDYALKACRVLIEQNIRFHYHIIGAKANEELRYLIDDMGLSQIVTLHSVLPQNQMIEQIRKANVLLLPSLHEGIANVVVEAMALGVPVVSTNCGGMSELIEHQEDGWLVPSRDPQAMALQLAEVASICEEDKQKIVLAARKKIEATFNREQMIEGMENLYQEVVQQKS